MDEGGTWSSRPDRGLGLGANRPIMGRRRRGGGPARCVRRRAPASASSGLGLHGESSHSWAGLGWAALDWIGLDWIGLDGRAGCTRGFASIGERERKEQGMRDPGAGSGQARSGQVVSRAAGKAISSKQVGWLAGGGQAGLQADSVAARRRRMSISMRFNWIDFPLTGGFCHRNLGGTQGRQTTYLPLPPTTYGPLPSLPAPAHRRRRWRLASRSPSSSTPGGWRRRACGWAVDGQLTHTQAVSGMGGGQKEELGGHLVDG